MHELSLCLNILQILERQSQLKCYKRIKTIWLEIGDLAGVEKEAILFNFPIAARNTLAENAQLNIIDIPGQAKCENCKIILNINNRFDACSVCGGYGLQVLGGDELRIYEVEVA